MRDSNNKLIAEFMGGIQSSSNIIRLPQTIGESSIFCVKGSEGLPSGTFKVERINELEYDTSWDWLMPVVEKIEGLAIEKYNPIKVEINGTSTYIKKASEPRFNISRAYSVKSRIQATHKAVVEFIKWYNENK